MASFARELRVPYAPEEMFDLVDDVDSYPQFLPWCVAAAARRDGADIEATLTLERGPLRHSFTTRNRHDREALRIEVGLLRGPLRDLKGTWRFIQEDAGCLVSFEIDYRFANRALDMLLGPLFARVYEHMVTAFAQRAVEVYGPR
ncbi:MAG: type II toxin-antitoxin system RatA family toxin [Betaproteobacteria bacterium AqS2]|uniref:Type II toxin-antitoxin system RatA family toxin n=1 Tax=Candidatus Amphirhobacter heronislandensis TaxID=1732024 RepID=A0A930Y104_9GAMM|nr:type II toxin-antitoxin system RatA family toxin [Betaproteobacteria bacterium AqS2]